MDYKRWFCSLPTASLFRCIPSYHHFINYAIRSTVSLLWGYVNGKILQAPTLEKKKKIWEDGLSGGQCRHLWRGNHKALAVGTETRISLLHFGLMRGFRSGGAKRRAKAAKTRPGFGPGLTRIQDESGTKYCTDYIRVCTQCRAWSAICVV